MLIFQVECECTEEKIIIHLGDDDLEPEFCPLCALEINAELIESSDE